MALVKSTYIISHITLVVFSH